jgi:hypothetical protein
VIRFRYAELLVPGRFGLERGMGVKGPWSSPGRRAGGGPGILPREAAPPLRAGGAGGNPSDGSRTSHSDDRSPPSPVVGAARGPASSEASHCNYKSQL